MIVSDVLTSVRSQLYEPSPGFWTDTELMSYLWQAEQEIALNIRCTQAQTAITTVTAQSMYTRPAAYYIDRLTWDKVKLKKIDFTDYDALQRVAYGGMYTVGRSMHYYEFDDQLGLWPIPSYSAPIDVYYVAIPSSYTASGNAFTVPVYFHNMIQDYALYRAFAKDQNQQQATFFKQQWDQGMQRAYTYWRQKTEDDFYRVVKEEDSYRNVELGMI
jgi:hypothetical protein